MYVGVFSVLKNKLWIKIVHMCWHSHLRCNNQQKTKSFFSISILSMCKPVHECACAFNFCLAGSFVPRQQKADEHDVNVDGLFPGSLHLRPN